jgi:hypothetical protein
MDQSMQKINKPIIQISYDAKIDNDLHLYRFVPLNRLHGILLKNQLTLTRTKTWEDVYENFLLKSSYHDGFFNNKTLEEYQDSLYGICFTLKRESDAIWRIYSQDKTSVRIRTSFKAIIKMLQRGQIKCPYHKLDIRIGVVKYPFITKIRAKYAGITENEIIVNFNDYLLESMFLKRNEFNHEKEFRIIIRGLNPIIKSIDELPALLTFPIDSNEFIESIAFDPRLDFRTYKTNKEVLRKIGYKNDIIRTNLYRFEGLSYKPENK